MASWVYETIIIPASHHKVLSISAGKVKVRKQNTHYTISQETVCDIDYPNRRGQYIAVMKKIYTY